VGPETRPGIPLPQSRGGVGNTLGPPSVQVGGTHLLPFEGFSLWICGGQPPTFQSLPTDLNFRCPCLFFYLYFYRRQPFHRSAPPFRKASVRRAPAGSSVRSTCCWLANRPSARVLWDPGWQTLDWWWSRPSFSFCRVSRHCLGGGGGELVPSPSGVCVCLCVCVCVCVLGGV